MSKYSRTRKAICRISKLKYWPINEETFRHTHPRTWKEGWKVQRKRHLQFYNYRYSFEKNRYCDLLKKYYSVWQIIKY